MRAIFAAARIIARRDFTALVFTPTFLLFLLAPLMMLVFAGIGGASAGALVENSGSRERIVAIVPSAEVLAFETTDNRLRAATGGGRAPQLIVIDQAQHRGDATQRLRANADILAILDGSSRNPHIAERNAAGAEGRYLAALADAIAREGLQSAARADMTIEPVYSTLPQAGPARASQSKLGYGAVIVLFMITLLLGSQTVGVLAEEKSNKVIEILAAAAPLEGVFLGKLVGMLGVALLFITFWGGLIGLGIGLTAAQMPAALGNFVGLTPAVGWPAFALLCILYFFSAFLLLGATFLGVGAQASSVREIQMLSLPITLLQLGMFSLGTAAANSPGSTVATIGEWLPWSSPFAMAARAATDSTLWPHLVAIGWQTLWIGLSIAVGVRLFRIGVLRSGGGGLRLFRHPQPDDATA